MNSQQKNGIFRLIAIQTGNKLSEAETSEVDPTIYHHTKKYNYLKLIKPETSFIFFNSYEVGQGGSVLQYNANRDLPALYKLEKNKQVNVEVSAVVGKNGSGKSSLLEIIYLAIYNLSVAKGILKDEDGNEVLEYENYLRCDLIYQTGMHKYLRLMFRFDENEHQCYVFESSTKDNKKFVFDIAVTLEDFKLEDFFYNIVVNYSIYGLNDFRLGDWISCLFHKNDSYQTPIVINPMRDHGNIDINKEESLTRQRLIANTVIKFNKSTTQNWITDYQYLSELIFKLDKTKIAFLEHTDVFNGNKREERTRTIEDLITQSKLPSPSEIINKALLIFTGNESDYKSVIYAKEIELYIVKKLYRIAITYEKYHKFLVCDNSNKPRMFDSTIDADKLTDYLLTLESDNTHVTTKLRQALNYLVNDPLENKDEYLWNNGKAGEIFKISFSEFASRLEGKQGQIIDHIPPSLFKTHINVQNKNTGQISPIETLSSGELQLINLIQSSLYHLNNIDSYNEENDDKIRYHNILLVFDEIELYFHPEYQRRIISTLLKEIDHLNLRLVKNIHVLFVTHSPFILSDIPRGKLLKLKEGEPSEDDNPTFAANIYEMLKSSFFLKASTGQFSIAVINDILAQLHKIIELKEKKNLNRNKLKIKIQKLSDSNINQIIKSIGDPIVRNKLAQMYDECLVGELSSRKKQIENEIDRLKNELKEIK